MKLDVRRDQLWKDKALVELNAAVLHSYNVRHSCHCLLACSVYTAHSLHSNCSTYTPTHTMHGIVLYVFQHVTCVM